MTAKCPTSNSCKLLPPEITEIVGVASDFTCVTRSLASNPAAAKRKMRPGTNCL